MQYLRLVTTAAFVIGLAGSALAQQQTGVPPVAPEGQSGYVAKYTVIQKKGEIVPPFNKTAEQLEKMDLTNSSGEQVARVGQVLSDIDGKPAAVTADVGGSVVIVPLDTIKLDNDRLVTSLSKDELAKQPTWKTAEQKQ